MKKIKIASLIVLCLAMLVSAVSCATAPKAADADGTCGTNITWKYTSADKTLTLTGNGDMTDYTSASEVPWYGAREAIETVKVGDGITKIGSYAFYYSPYLKNVEIANSVTAIGNYSFALCSALESLDIPASVTSIGNSAFEACSSLADVRVPSSVTSLGKRAFGLCAKLKNAYILGDIARLDDETFYNCYSLETLMLNPSITADKVSESAFKHIEFSYDKAQFAASVDATSVIIIEYVYEDGTHASASFDFGTLALGEAYSRNSPNIDGYTADILTVSGVAQGKDETIRVTYKKNAEVTTAPEETTTQAPEETGDKNKGGGYVAIIIMAVVIVGICVAAFFIVRAEKKEEAKRQNQNKAKNRKKK